MPSVSTLVQARLDADLAAVAKKYPEAAALAKLAFMRGLAAEREYHQAQMLRMLIIGACLGSILHALGAAAL